VNKKLRGVTPYATRAPKEARQPGNADGEQGDAEEDSGGLGGEIVLAFGGKGLAEGGRLLQWPKIKARYHPRR
jgi:hypothetical protein